LSDFFLQEHHSSSIYAVGDKDGVLDQTSEESHIQDITFGTVDMNKIASICAHASSEENVSEIIKYLLS
jgi:hypothetical protein